MSNDTVRILFVDDDALVLRTIGRAIRTAAVKPYFTSDPAQAAGIVAREGIDIVVSDQMMPHMSGIELLRTLRALYEPVLRVMLTGQNDRQTAVDAVNIGNIHRFLEKPWDADRLCDVVNELAREVRAHRRIARAQTLLPPPHRAAKTITRDMDGTVVLPAPEST